MKTPAYSDGAPEIEWEKGDHVDSHDHEEVYGADGESADGRKWIGAWIVTDGHYDEIHDIEEA